MATLGEYFESEARDCLAQLDRELERPLPSAAELHRAARALRGSAQMAREDRMLRAASALEAAARALLDRAVDWSDDVGQRARQTIADLRALLDRRGADEFLDTTVDSVVTRWRNAGVNAAAPAVRLEGATPSEFRAFAAREVAGIIEALEGGVQQLAAAPMDREPLKMILRRQRALLGAARLEEVPVVAEILRAVDDLTRVIAKLDVGVKREWLDIYRVARDALKAAVEPLQRDENPPPTHPLSRLRHMRAELLERYGTGDAVSPAHTSQGFTTATPVQELPGPAYLRTDTPPAAAAEESLLLAEDDIVSEIESELLLEDEALSADRAELLLEDVTADDEAAPLELGEQLLELDDEQLLELEDEQLLELEDEQLLELGDEQLLTLENELLLQPDDEQSLELEEEQVLQLEDEQLPAPEDEVVPIEALQYDRNQALRRALELRDVIANHDVTEPATRAALDELFDLIHLALR